MKRVIDYTLITLLVGAAVLTAMGCGAPMVQYYRATATAADAARTCYRVVDSADDAKLTAAKQLLATNDLAGARLLRDDWLPKYAGAKKACDALDALASEALAAGPVVEKAINKDKAIGDWITQLTTLAIKTVATLSDLGIKIPMLGGAQ